MAVLLVKVAPSPLGAATNTERRHDAPAANRPLRMTPPPIHFLRPDRMPQAKKAVRAGGLWKEKIFRKTLAKRMRRR